jgi:hypothetical protein
MEHYTFAGNYLILYYFDPVQGKQERLELAFIGPEGNMPQSLHFTSLLRRISG